VDGEVRAILQHLATMVVELQQVEVAAAFVVLVVEVWGVVAVVVVEAVVVEAGVGVVLMSLLPYY